MEKKIDENDDEEEYFRKIYNIPGCIPNDWINKINRNKTKPMITLVTNKGNQKMYYGCECHVMIDRVAYYNRNGKAN